MTEENNDLLTEQDFKLFKAECERWIDAFSLRSWNIIYLWTDTDNENRGECYLQSSGKKASISLNPALKQHYIETFPNNIFDFQKIIKETALHEVLEIMLTQFEYIIK